jgi:hypothetical protein
MDKVQMELRRLKYAVKIWTMKAIANKFSGNDDEIPAIPSTPGKFSGSQAEEEVLLKRNDVQQYIESINSLISTKLDGSVPSPRKVRLSIASPMFRRGGATTAAKSTFKLQELHPQHLMPARSTSKSSMITDDDADDEDDDDFDPCKQDLFSEGRSNYRSRESVLNYDMMKERALDNHDPDESERMIGRMMEVQNISISRM